MYAESSRLGPWLCLRTNRNDVGKTSRDDDNFLIESYKYI